MDAFEPDVGVATLQLLERLGCTVDYPFASKRAPHRRHRRWFSIRVTS
jgi:hypothetical protein